MCPTRENFLDKAEALARRVFQRLASNRDVDSKTESQPSSEPRLTVELITELLENIERIIEANLRAVPGNTGSVAPNRFKVLLTYEETSGLSQQYMEAVSKELTSEVVEFVANRRYNLSGPIIVELVSDVLTRETAIRHSFENESMAPAAASTSGVSVSHSPTSATLLLSEPDGTTHPVALKAGGDPVYIGRASECAVRLTDASISRLHCSVGMRHSGDVVLGDLGSANGTSVDGHRLGSSETCVINSSKRVEIGDVTLSVSLTLE
jgi:hypothetical protein